MILPFLNFGKRTSTGRTAACALLLAISGSSLGQTISAEYAITEVPFESGYAAYLSETGVTAGHTPDGGALWTPDGGYESIELPPFWSSQVAGFNRRGDLLISSDQYFEERSRAIVRRQNGELIMYPHSFISTVRAIAVNNEGELVQSSTHPDFGTVYSFFPNPFFSGGSMPQLSDINENGTILGQGQVRPRNGTWQPLESPSIATFSVALNDREYTVGYSNTSSTSVSRNLILWNNQREIVHSVSIGGFTGFGNEGAYVSDLNEFEEVVGAHTLSGEQRAIVWSPLAGVVDLNTRIGSASGQYLLKKATQINDRGQILAVASSSSGGKLVLLNPVPEPASLTALAVGVLTMVRRRIRK